MKYPNHIHLINELRKLPRHGAETPEQKAKLAKQYNRRTDKTKTVRKAKK